MPSPMLQASVQRIQIESAMGEEERARLYEEEMERIELRKACVLW